MDFNLKPFGYGGSETTNSLPHSYKVSASSDLWTLILLMKLLERARMQDTNKAEVKR